MTPEVLFPQICYGLLISYGMASRTVSGSGLWRICCFDLGLLTNSSSLVRAQRKISRLWCFCSPSPMGELLPLHFCSPAIYHPMKYFILLHCIYLSLSLPLVSGLKDFRAIADSFLCLQHIAWCLAHGRCTERVNLMSVDIFWSSLNSALSECILWISWW